MPLGRSVVEEEGNTVSSVLPTPKVNTRTALWTERWPAIALQVCIDQVEAADPDDQVEVKRNLPCADCEKNTGCLTAKRKELGPLLYDREILTSPRSSESTLFPFAMFAPMLRTDLGMLDSYRKQSRHEVVVSGWDLAWSEKVGGDRLVRCTSVMNRQTMKKRLLSIKRYPEGLRYKQQLELIKHEHARYQEDLVIVESDAAQVIWSQSLEDESDVPVMRHAAGDDKQDFQTGVPGLLIDFDSLRWLFPYNADAPGYTEMKALLAEFGAFGWHNGKLEGVGAHDDMVMAFWHCWWGLKMMSARLSEMRAGNQPGRTA